MIDLVGVSKYINLNEVSDDEIIAKLILEKKGCIAEYKTRSLNPVIINFKELISNNTTFRITMDKMIQEVPWWFKYNHLIRL